MFISTLFLYLRFLFSISCFIWGFYHFLACFSWIFSIFLYFARCGFNFSWILFLFLFFKHFFCFVQLFISEIFSRFQKNKMHKHMSVCVHFFIFSFELSFHWSLFICLFSSIAIGSSIESLDSNRSPLSNCKKKLEGMCAERSSLTHVFMDSGFLFFNSFCWSHQFYGWC